MKRYIRSAVTPLADVELDIRREIARDPETSAEVLEQLYSDSIASTNWNNKYFIGLELAANPNTPLHILEKLTHLDVDDRVRRQVAENPSTPIELLKYLYRSPGSCDVWIALAKNPNTPNNILWELAKRDTTLEAFNSSYECIREGVAMNPNTTSDILDYLSTDRSAYVRAQVAKNKNTPISTLKRMLEDDKTYYVQDYLGKNPNINILLEEPE